MSTAATVVVSIVALGICVANLAFWWWVVRSGEPAFQRVMGERFGVTIVRGSRGHWTVVSEGPWLKHLLIELLQLAFFMSAMLVWGIAMLASAVVLELVQRVL